tara:strand:- start:89 stop:475 length:387 start_codon:yes stop_codon:yes gene_type:complete
VSKAKKQVDKIDKMMKESVQLSEELNKAEEKLPSIEEIANSNRWFKSATPKQTLDWYVKWVASAMLLTGMSMRGIEGLQLYDLTISIGGVTLWLWVSILWKDRALIVVNSVGLLLLARNLITMLTDIL